MLKNSFFDTWIYEWLIFLISYLFIAKGRGLRARRMLLAKMNEVQLLIVQVNVPFKFFYLFKTPSSPLTHNISHIVSHLYTPPSLYPY